MSTTDVAAISPALFSLLGHYHYYCQSLLLLLLTEACRNTAIMLAALSTHTHTHTQSQQSCNTEVSERGDVWSSPEHTSHDNRHTDKLTQRQQRAQTYQQCETRQNTEHQSQRHTFCLSNIKPNDTRSACPTCTSSTTLCKLLSCQNTDVQ